MVLGMMVFTRLILCLSLLVAPLMADPLDAPARAKAQIHRLTESTALLGITLTAKPGWHTYWSNPGDAGMALSVTLADEAIQIDAEEFPTPTRFEKMGIVGYGYEGEATFLYYLSGPLPETLTGDARWLTCDENSCRPGHVEFALPLPALSTQAGEMGSEAPAWLMAAEATQPTRLDAEPLSIEVQGKTCTIQFRSSQNLVGFAAYPAQEALSEGRHSGIITAGAEENSYEIRLHLTGELPNTLGFIAKKGMQAYKLSFIQQ